MLQNLAPTNNLEGTTLYNSYSTCYSKKQSVYAMVNVHWQHDWIGGHFGMNLWTCAQTVSREIQIRYEALPQMRMTQPHGLRSWKGDKRRAINKHIHLLLLLYCGWNVASCLTPATPAGSTLPPWLPHCDVLCPPAADQDKWFLSQPWGKVTILVFKQIQHLVANRQPVLFVLSLMCKKKYIFI